MTDKQLDAALAAAMTGGNLKPQVGSLPPGAGQQIAGVAASSKIFLGSSMAKDGLATEVKEGVVGAGVAAKAAQDNAAIGVHIDQLYQEYRVLARSGRVSAALRDSYAKEKIGPRLDTIQMNEINWLGKQPTRTRLAGQVQARVELVEIERQEGAEEALRRADALVLLQQKEALDGKGGDDQPISQELMRRKSLAVFKSTFEASPEFAEAERIKKLHLEMQAIEKQGNAAVDCPPDKVLPVALPRRGGNTGSALFQNAINQAEQDEKDRPAREARERVERARAAAESERLATVQRLSNARAQANAEREASDNAAVKTKAVMDAVIEVLDAVGKIQKAKQDSKRPAPTPGGSGSIGCGGIGATTCR